MGTRALAGERRPTTPNRGKVARWTDAEVIGLKLALQQFRIVLVAILLNLEILLVPHQLHNFKALSKINRGSFQCLVRMDPI